ncbi:19617_t:CDS:2, partial [Rhizophagus irregularis]
SNEISVQNTSNEQARSRIITIARRENLQIQRKFATVGSFVKAADAISSVPAWLYVGRGSPFNVFVVKRDGKVYELMVREDEENMIELDAQRDLLFDVFVLKSRVFGVQRGLLFGVFAVKGDGKPSKKKSSNVQEHDEMINHLKMDIRRHHWFSWSKINDYDLIKITLKNLKRNVNNKAFLRWTMGILMNVLQELPNAENVKATQLTLWRVNVASGDLPV